MDLCHISHGNGLHRLRSLCVSRAVERSVCHLSQNWSKYVLLCCKRLRFAIPLSLLESVSSSSAMFLNGSEVTLSRFFGSSPDVVMFILSCVKDALRKLVSSAWEIMTLSL